MPYMTRQEIINKYGFDPGLDEAQSTFVKKQDAEEESEEIRMTPSRPLPAPSEASATTPSEAEAPEAPGPTPVPAATIPNAEHINKETPTANPASMAASGAIRSWISDPLLLAGMASAGFSAAAKKVTGQGDFGEEFTKGLYKEGGVEAVKEHLREKQQQLQTEHPEMGAEDLKKELLKYQTSDEFFKFHTDQMAGAYGTGMKLAYWANQRTGANKKPEQETWADEAAQILGSVIIPSPGIFMKGARAFTKAIGATTPKAIDIGAKTLDAVLIPGTGASHYGPGAVALGAGAGMAINEGIRGLSGEPTVIGGDALTQRDPVVGGPSVAAGSVDTSARAGDYLIPGAVAAAGVLAGTRALRGRPRIDLSPVEGGLSRADQIAAERARVGFEPLREDPSLAAQPITKEAIGTAINESAPLERVARDAVDAAEARAAQTGSAPNVTKDALEVDVQAAHGMDMARPARNAAIETARTDGVFPDRSRAPVTVQALEERAKGAAPESVARFNEAVTAINVQDTRNRGTTELQARVTANPNDADAARLLRERLADTPESRAQFQGWSNQDVGRRISDAMADPEAREMLDMFAQVNRSINDYQYRAGMLTQKEYLDRHQNPYHIPLYEFTGESSYDPARSRGTVVDPLDPSIVPNRSIDAFSGANLNLAMAIDSGKINAGRKRVIDQLAAADTVGEFIRRLGPASQVERRLPDMVGVYEGGREIVYQFSRESVANALAAQPLTLGSLAGVANKGRQAFHFLTTGPYFGGIPTAVSSAIYDVGAAYVTARQGRSFGYASKWARAINARLGDNRVVDRLIDTARTFDVTAPIQTAAAIPQMAMWRTVDAVGRQLADAASRRSGLLGSIARTPAGRQWLQDSGAAIAQTVERSLYGIMKHGGVLQPHAMMGDSFAIKNRYEKLIAQHQNAGMGHPIRQALHTVATPWLALIDNIHNSAKYAFYASNYTVLEHRYKGRIPEVELTRLAEETRRIAGDIQAHGGSQLYNETMAMVPYGNIAVQANRHMLHAAFAQGSKQSFDVGLRLTMLGMGAYAGISHVSGLGDQAKDWYWNRLNEWERLGTIPIPSIDSIMHKVRTGEWLPFNPERPFDSFMTMGSHMPRMAAEVVPFYQVGLAAAESAGLFDRGRNTAKGSPMQDVRGAVAGSLNLGTFLPLSVGMAATGTKVDFMNPMRGRGAVSQVTAPKGEDGRTPGGIPAVPAEAAKALFGLGMDVLIQATDAGLQDRERGASFVEALSRAGLEARTKLVDERYPSVPGLWKASEKIYNSNAEGTRIKNLERTEREIKKTWQTEFGQGVATLPEAGRIQDPDVRMTVAYAHAFFDKAAYQQMVRQRGMLEQQRNNLDAQKDRYTPEQINEKKRQYDIQIRAAQGRMLPVIEMYEKAMSQGRMGEVFKRHGLEPSLDSVPTLVQLYKRKAPR